MLVMIRSATRPAPRIAQVAFGVLLAWNLLAIAPTKALADVPYPARRAVDLYLRELARVEKSSEHLSMEPLFVRADSLDNYLFPPELTESIEGLPEAELDSLQALL